MCCFTVDVERVFGTRIFVRGLQDGRQLVVYGMSFDRSARGELAMILPLPVPPRPPEDAVRFISLERAGDFFAMMERGFPEREAPVALAMAAASLAGGAVRKLEVHRVGAFEASFVPTLDDFARLDAKFKLPRDAWQELPTYTDYGFAVFKLLSRGAPLDVHPMAFEFPRRDAAALFVPTLHIHHGRYRPLARFDHEIYCQPDATLGTAFDAGIERSSGPANGFMDTKRTAGIVEGSLPCFRKRLDGHLRNRDVLASRGSNGLARLRLEGSPDEATWAFGAHEFAEALVGELLLEYPDALGPEGGRRPEVRAAVQRAREHYLRTAPRSLGNRESYIEALIDPWR